MSQDRFTFSSPSKFLSQKNKHMLAELVNLRLFTFRIHEPGHGVGASLGKSKSQNY